MMQIREGAFFSALFCGLRLRGRTCVGARNPPLLRDTWFHDSVHQAYRSLWGLGYAPRFRIKTDSLHGLSGVVYQGVQSLLGGLLTLDAPRGDVLRLNFDREDALDLLLHLEIPESDALELAERFLRAYDP